MSEKTARGTLIKKTQRQEAYWTNQPPSTGPSNEEAEVNPDQVPIARPRWSALNEALRIARLPGTISAPPMPSTARARIRNSTVGEKPQAIEARIKTTMPLAKMRRRPK